MSVVSAVSDVDTVSVVDTWSPLPGSMTLNTKTPFHILFG